MPPKLCGKCNKQVYPTEELKCLDKVWHKGCFKCQTCNMALTMKNYKGYDKMPYCNVHYPQTKPTVVADTPESRRIAENTKIQSNIKYHEDFEKQKGQKTSVAVDPEIMRARMNMEVISNVSYHGEQERHRQMEMARPAEQLEGQYPEQSGHRGSDPLEGNDDADDAAGRMRQTTRGIVEQPPADSPYSNRNSAGARQVYDSNFGKDRVQRFSSDYDEQSSMEQTQARKVGSISDYDPLNEKYGSITGQHNPNRAAPQQSAPAHHYQPTQYHQPARAEPQPPTDKYAGKGLVCQALYDYDAADSDEVSFREGDMVILCHPIDAGWMEGTVEKSGQRGMLPSNYVEKIN